MTDDDIITQCWLLRFGIDSLTCTVLLTCCKGACAAAGTGKKWILSVLFKKKNTHFSGIQILLFCNSIAMWCFSWGIRFKECWALVQIRRLEAGVGKSQKEFYINTFKPNFQQDSWAEDWNRQLGWKTKQSRVRWKKLDVWIVPEVIRRMDEGVIIGNRYRVESRTSETRDEVTGDLWWM